MNFKDSIKEINKEFKTTPQALDVASIEIGGLVDDFNDYFIAIKDYNGTAFLTDYAKTCEYFDIEEDELKELCSKYNLTFDNWYVKKEYESNKDIENYINFLDEVANR